MVTESVGSQSMVADVRKVISFNILVNSISDYKGILNDTHGIHSWIRLCDLFNSKPAPFSIHLMDIAYMRASSTMTQYSSGNSRFQMFLPTCGENWKKTSTR